MNSIDLKDNLKKFVKNIMWGERGWCDNVDGADLQDMAEKAGLIELVQKDEPCCPHCACAEIGRDFPVMCYTWTEGME